MRIEEKEFTKSRKNDLNVKKSRTSKIVFLEKIFDMKNISLMEKRCQIFRGSKKAG